MCTDILLYAVNRKKYTCLNPIFQPQPWSKTGPVEVDHDVDAVLILISGMKRSYMTIFGVKMWWEIQLEKRL